MALREYGRVAKPGAVIGLNEATWIKTPPSGLSGYLTNTVSLQGEILTREGWLTLMADAGLQELTAEIHQVKTIKNPKDDIADLLRTLPKLLFRMGQVKASRLDKHTSCTHKYNDSSELASVEDGQPTFMKITICPPIEIPQPNISLVIAKNIYLTG